MIDNLEGLREVVYKKTIFKDPKKTINIEYNESPIYGKMHCPKCGDIRKMDVNLLFPQRDENSTSLRTISIHLSQSGYRDEAFNKEFLRRVYNLLCPSLWKYECLQCNTTFTSIVYMSPQGHDLAVFASCYGGLSTPNTPESVAYYLDQANRSFSVGAHSAAMAMYRSALEHLLFNQGYTKGMLAVKIELLIKDIEKNSAPRWAMDLEPELLRYIKDLGNGSIHANNGAVDQQRLLDTELITKVNEFFSILLFVVYESENKRKQLLDSFKHVSEQLNEY